jgi:hypothetical protein
MTPPGPRPRRCAGRKVLKRDAHVPDLKVLHPDSEDSSETVDVRSDVTPKSSALCLTQQASLLTRLNPTARR